MIGPPIDWMPVWGDVAHRVGAHRSAGRGHLITEDSVRQETILALGDRGVAPDRLAVEVLAPALTGGKIDLVVDPPVGTVIELKYPRDSRTGFSPDTMTFGELLRDFVRVAAVQAHDRWVVQVLNARLVRYLDGVCSRHGLHWPTSAGDVLELRPETLAMLPGTAVRAVGAVAAFGAVTANCRATYEVGADLALYAHQVNAAIPIYPGVAVSSASVAPPDLAVVSPPPRGGARREIVDAARAVVLRSGKNAFTMNDVITELHSQGTPYADATIRTMISSHLCAGATGAGVAGYADFSRLDRGVYRLTSWNPGLASPQ